MRNTLASLARSPVFALVAFLSLGLGIGAVTVIAALADALLFRQLPARDANRLVRVGSTVAGEGFNALSYGEYLDLRREIPAFSGILAHAPNQVVMSAGAEPMSASMEVVSDNYFDVLGIRPTPGRGFRPEEGRVAGERPVVVISHPLWRGRFGGDPDVIGRSIRVNGHPFEIVGVAPAGFTGTFAGFRIDLWIPVMMQAQVLPNSGRLDDRTATFLMLIGRLRDGATVAEAQTQLDAAASRFAAAYPRGREETFVRGLRVGGSGGVHPFIASLVRAFVVLLLGMVSVVLLISCANVANLMLVRVESRRREIAVRVALGARRARVAGIFLMEGLAIALCGGALGLGIGMWVTRALSLWRPDVGIPLGLMVSVDARVAAFALLVTLSAATLFSFLPALRASAGGVMHGLRGAGSGGRSKLRNALVVSQVAMSALLLFGALLLQQSLRRSRTVDAGFDSSGIVVLRASPELLGYDEQRGRALWREMSERIRQLPGVRDVALGLFIPLGDRSDMMRVSPNDAPGGAPGDMTNYTFVSPGWFDLLGVSLERGRDFSDGDVAGERVAIVTAAFAAKFWPDDEPVGRVFQIADREGIEHETTVVGVTADFRYRSLGESARPVVFLPYTQWYRPDMVLFVRAPSGIDPSVLGAELRAIEPDLPAEIVPLDEKTAFTLIPLRLAGAVLSASGLIGLFLAVTGVFGVVAYAVSRQVRDMAIRMALGAGSSRIHRLVVSGALRLVLIGLVIGLGTGTVAARLVSSFLYGVGIADPVSLAVVVASFLLCATAAAWPSARRASAFDPALVLRED